ncbi:MAG: hypothetical protein DMF84_13985 [Acidobacteria bacterium]|nr:MAG: hypothetical protein DMF84_13985 [Acidobacteriota bacterium]
MFDKAIAVDASLIGSSRVKPAVNYLDPRIRNGRCAVRFADETHEIGRKNDHLRSGINGVRVWCDHMRGGRSDVNGDIAAAYRNNAAARRDHGNRTRGQAIRQVRVSDHPRR